MSGVVRGSSHAKRLCGEFLGLFCFFEKALLTSSPALQESQWNLPFVTVLNLG